MSISQTTAHVTEALVNLLEQFKNKPKMAALLTAYVNQIQDIEDAFYGLMLGRWLDNAEGTQLDGLGDIVGESREGRYDEDYRLAIRARIKINLCEGTPEQILEIFWAMTDSALQIKDYYPAAFVLTILEAITGYLSKDVELISRPTGDTLINRDGKILLGKVADSSSFAEMLSNILQEIKPAGVKAQMIYWLSPTDEVFRYDSGPGYDQGHWAGVI